MPKLLNFVFLGEEKHAVELKNNFKLTVHLIVGQKQMIKYSKYTFKILLKIIRVNLVLSLAIELLDWKWDTLRKAIAYKTKCLRRTWVIDRSIVVGNFNPIRNRWLLIFPCHPNPLSIYLTFLMFFSSVTHTNHLRIFNKDLIIGVLNAKCGECVVNLSRKRKYSLKLSKSRI